MKRILFTGQGFTVGMGVVAAIFMAWNGEYGLLSITLAAIGVVVGGWIHEVFSEHRKMMADLKDQEFKRLFENEPEPDIYKRGEREEIGFTIQ